MPFTMWPHHISCTSSTTYPVFLTSCLLPATAVLVPGHPVANTVTGQLCTPCTMGLSTGLCVYDGVRYRWCKHVAWPLVMLP
ncbi:hypothetical protein V8C86DRAFT_2542204 [Haematococcus lacustris]